MERLKEPQSRNKNGLRNWQAVEIQVVFSVLQFSFFISAFLCTPTPFFAICGLAAFDACSQGEDMASVKFPSLSSADSAAQRGKGSLSFWVSIPNSKEGTLVGPFCVNGPFVDQSVTSKGQDQTVEL